jgi:hypothetical protein
MTTLHFSPAERSRRIANILLVVMLTLAMAPARADGFRCGVHLVDPGMQMFEVADACGEPVQVTHTSVQRPSVIWLHGRSYLGDGFIEVPVETWVYNFGSTRLMQQLTFESGVLVEVIALDYGYERN